MFVQRLSWAGVLLQAEGTSIMIDPVGERMKVEGLMMGEPKLPLSRLGEWEKPDAIFVTHQHEDHFDAPSILEAYGDEVPVHVPAAAADYLRKSGLKQLRGVQIGEAVQVGPFFVTAVQSVDGFGAPQVAWVAEAGGKRVIHCGDTLWHGYWWQIARKFGPFDAAFLPVNGAVVETGLLPRNSRLEACLNPEQAVEAAFLLGAKRLVPIHYEAFHNPPFYVQTDNVTERLKKAASEREVNLCMLEAREGIEIL